MGTESGPAFVTFLLIVVAGILAKGYHEESTHICATIMLAAAFICRAIERKREGSK